MIVERSRDSGAVALSGGQSRPAAIATDGSVPSQPSAQNFLWRRMLIGAWKFVVGVVCTQSFLLSIVLAGWMQRWMQRVVVQQWWRRSRPTAGTSFRDFCLADAQTYPLGHWPNWVRGDHYDRGQPSSRCRCWFGSLAANFRVGLSVLLNTWVLTLPGCALWLFAWYDGWNNSFNKGYEQYWVGPITGWLGVLLFIGAMYYVPMAQARQAATGDWRSFYDFRLIARLVRREWFGSLVLASLYVIGSLPLAVLKTLPVALGVGLSWDRFTEKQLHSMTSAYFLACGGVFLGVLALTRYFAARLYARAIYDGVQAGVVSEDDLSAFEWETLHRLGLSRVYPPKLRPALVRSAAWLGTRAGQATAATLLSVLWFSFVAQVFISEFFNRNAAKGWLNQPLVQLPWFNFTPGHLQVNSSHRRTRSTPACPTADDNVRRRHRW